MSRKYSRYIANGHTGKVIPMLARGISIERLLSTGTGYSIGEQIEISGTKYIVKEGGFWERIGSKHPPLEKSTKDTSFFPREYAHLNKSVRKGKSYEEIKLLRESEITNKKDTPLGV
jgi:hypothetical protein